MPRAHHRRTPHRAITVVVALATVPAALVGQSAPTLALPELPIDTFTLDNGLRVIVSEDHSAPLVAVSTWYDVGSAHEEPGRSGFAHLFEHMLFEETENLAAGEMDRLISRAGGRYNGTTNTDRTAYYEVLPANRLDLALWLQAERMARVRVSAEGFENQRQIVKEERRQRVDNTPYAVAQLTVDTVANRGFEPYRHTVIGSMEDLDAATVDEVRAFYRRHYAPNRATLVVVGAVGVDEVRESVERYLGGIPSGPDPVELPSPPVIPRTDGERRVEVDAPLARLPLLWIAHGIPPASHEDHAALGVLSQIFSTGRSSRLRERLVDGERAALDVVGLVEWRAGPGMLLFGAIPNQGVGTDRLVELIQDEIERIQRDGVTEREMTKALNQLRAQAVTQRLTAEGKATILQSYAFYFGSPHLANGALARTAAVTAADVARVARTYLGPANRTVVIARPPGGE